MNSFNTHTMTQKILNKYQNHSIQIETFNQSRYPRIFRETLLPLPTNINGTLEDWYPPGHGDIFPALVNSGLLDKFLAEGREYLFISNVDNLGATVDLSTLLLSQSQSFALTYLIRLSILRNFETHGGDQQRIYHGGDRQDQS